MSKNEKKKENVKQIKVPEKLNVELKPQEFQFLAQILSRPGTNIGAHENMMLTSVNMAIQKAGQKYNDILKKVEQVSGNEI